MKNIHIKVFFAIFTVLGLIFTTCSNPADSAKPAFTGQVSFINTTFRVGEPVTAIFNGNGTGEQTWQWYRITPGTEVELTSNSNTYTPVDADIGFPIKASISFADQSGSISATTAQLVAPVPNYGISLSETGSYIFPDAVQGYKAQMPLSVTITNTGNQATVSLTVALLGEDENAFTLSTESLNNINPGSSVPNAFTVIPNNDLDAGTYTATVTVSGGNNISEQFNISFSVTATYSIALSETDTYTFPLAVSALMHLMSGLTMILPSIYTPQLLPYPAPIIFPPYSM